MVMINNFFISLRDADGEREHIRRLPILRLSVHAHSPLGFYVSAFEIFDFGIIKKSYFFRGAQRNSLHFVRRNIIHSTVVRFTSSQTGRGDRRSLLLPTVCHD